MASITDLASIPYAGSAPSDGIPPYAEYDAISDDGASLRGRTEDEMFPMKDGLVQALRSSALMTQKAYTTPACSVAWLSFRR